MPAEAEGSGAPPDTPETSDKATAPRMSAGVDALDESSEYSEEAIAAAMRDKELMEADVQRALMEDERPEKYNPAAEEAVDIRDEGAQRNFDQMTVSNTIRALREALANQKVNYWLANKGLLVAPPGARAPHPNQIRDEIRKTRLQLEWLVEVSHSEVAIEYPSDIEIATVVPQQGEAQKLGIA